MLRFLSARALGRVLLAFVFLAVIMAQAVVAAGRVSDSLHRLRSQPGGQAGAIPVNSHLP